MEFITNDESFTDCSSPADSSAAINVSVTSTVDRIQCPEEAGSFTGSGKDRRIEVFRCPKCGHEADKFIGPH